jgi:hypothetical protein
MARPEIDGYFDDWPLSSDSLRSMRGSEGPVVFAVGSNAQAVYLYIDVRDRNVVYGKDQVELISSSPPYLQERIIFKAEAPGRILSTKQNQYGFAPEPTISAWWQDVPGGYRVEARIPSGLQYG